MTVRRHVPATLRDGKRPSPVLRGPTAAGFVLPQSQYSAFAQASADRDQPVTRGVAGALYAVADWLKRAD
jgi:hypothetical protein